jgi:hypothetical protein
MLAMGIVIARGWLIGVPSWGMTSSRIFSRSWRVTYRAGPTAERTNTGVGGQAALNVVHQGEGDVMTPRIMQAHEEIPCSNDAMLCLVVFTRPVEVRASGTVDTVRQMMLYSEHRSSIGSSI